MLISGLIRVCACGLRRLTPNPSIRRMTPVLAYASLNPSPKLGYWTLHRPQNICVGSESGGWLGWDAIRDALGGHWLQFFKASCGRCLADNLGGAVSAPLVRLLAYARTPGVILRTLWRMMPKVSISHYFRVASPPWRLPRRCTPEPSDGARSSGRYP